MARRTFPATVVLCLFPTSLLLWADKPQTTKDPAEIARAALKDLKTKPFVGRLLLALKTSTADGSETIRRQGATLYTGPKGEIRLDPRTKPGTAPVIACAIGSEAWAVFPRSPLVGCSPWPLDFDRVEPGWHRRLYYQTRQAEVWADLVVPRTLASADVLMASRQGDTLHATLRFPGVDRSVRVEFRRFEARWLPHVLRFASGMSVTYEGWCVTPDGMVFPRTVTQLTKSRGNGKTRPVRHVWSIQLAPPGADPTPFKPPAQRSARFPDLIGERCVTADGAETARAWDAARQP